MTGVVIETARLRLRALRDEDLADLVQLIGNWQVARWLTAVPYPYTPADGYAWILSVRRDHEGGNPRRFGIALKEADRIIGGVGLDGDPGDDTDEAALGYWLGQPYWRNGYGREAVAAIIEHGFRALDLASIRAYTDPDNAPSQKLLRHCGLAQVGDIDLARPTRNSGARRAPLFRIWRP